MTPLHRLGDLVRDALLLIPLPVVKMLFVGTFVALLIWVWRLPRSETTPPGGPQRWDQNLKLVATLALGFQILVYLLL